MVYSRVSRSAWSIKWVALFICILSILSLIVVKPNQQVSAQANSTYFAIGPGFTDVTSHQIVRTNTDRVFIFAAQAQYSSVLVGYWTTAAGLPTTASNFNGTATVTEAANIISVDAAYNGSSIIHVLIITQAGAIKDYPFDTTTNIFHAPITLATDSGTVSGDYIGTAGISGMVDLSGQLHVSHWTATNHILHRVYTYAPASNTLTPVGVATQVDTAGHATHPTLAVSPANNSVTIAWVSETNAQTGNILARTRSAAGVWGAVETVSTADAWTSTSAGINIDQSPSLLIGSNGAKYLSYIQDNDSSGSYGRIHFASFNGAWQDSAVAIAGTDPKLVINGSTYTHDPALALNNAGEFYIIGHGPTQTNVNNNMYTMRRNANGTWSIPTLFASGNTFDSSPSVKWAAVGNNRPNTYEFLFFLAPAGDYSHTTLYYGRFGDATGIIPTQAAPLRNYYTTGTPELTWGHVSWATAYQIEVAHTTAFGATVAFTSTVSSDMLSAVTSVLPDGIYFWHVRAKKPDGSWSGWSITERFEVNVP